jgi:molybdenum cofactor guanylyltransferase
LKRLGAIIAGGKATRFGGDKAAAMLNGRPLIDHVVEGLRKQVDHLIVVGREWPGLESVSDLPSADLGPLGGINAAFQYAQKNGFDEVMTAGCDVLPVPDFQRERLDGQANYIEGHYLLGVSYRNCEYISKFEHALGLSAICCSKFDFWFKVKT